MNLKTYPVYKKHRQTRLHWVDQVPDDWEVLRIKDFATFNDDVVDERLYRDSRIRYVDISGVSSASNTYTFEEQSFSAAPSRARRLVQAGDTVFSTVRPYLKAVATIQQPEDNLVFSTGFAVIRPTEKADPRFVGYLLRNERFVDEVTANSVGASYPAINASDLVKLHVVLPPITEQRSIANFLDDKCAKIDEAMRIKEKQIALLRERSQILIQRAVTRGLDPAAPMRDSGTDWIGKIPAHWDLRHNKFLFTLKKVLVGNGAPNYELLSLTLRGIIKRDIENHEGKFPAEFDTYQEVQPGDFVFCHFDVEETPRTVGLSTHAGMITGAYTVYVPTKEANSRFLLHFYIFADTGKKMRGLYKGLRNTISKDSFASFKTPLPPKEEQDAIVRFIDSKREEVDAAVRIKQDQIAALKEYKTSLINAAVTGKMKVI